MCVCFGVGHIHAACIFLWIRLCFVVQTICPATVRMDFFDVLQSTHCDFVTSPLTVLHFVVVFILLHTQSLSHATL